MAPFLGKAIIGVTAAALIVSSQLTVENDDTFDIDGAQPAGSFRLEAADDCADLTQRVREIARSQSEAVDGRAGDFGRPAIAVEQGSGGELVVGREAAVVPDMASSEADTGFAAPAAAPLTAGAGDDGGSKVVGTNVQELGVDETDILKTDGETIFVLHDGLLEAVDADTLDSLDRLRFGRNSYPSDMLLAGDRVVLFESTWRQTESPEGEKKGSNLARDMWMPGEPILRLIVVDVSNPSALEIAKTVEVDGGLIAARLVGGHIRVVTSNSPQGWYGAGPVLTDDVAIDIAVPAPGRPGFDAPRPANLDADDILPSVRVSAPDGAEETFTMPCRSVYVAPDAETLESTTVFSLDPNDPKPVGEATALAGGGIVYASTESIYLARVNWRRSGERTEIHRFDISDANASRYVSAGIVPGSPLNQFSMSEHEGHLRIATTDGGNEANNWTSQSEVNILAERGDDLTVVGTVGGLGKTERIFAVRFLGTRGYVVTFRQVDPLYVLDLADPASPKLLGELKIPGYSAYLHPVGENMLVGVGQDATKQGMTTGVQVSLFDVSDPANPKRIAKLDELGDYSPVEHDHRAFQYLADRNLIVVPATSWNYDSKPQPVEPAPDRPRAQDGGGTDGGSGDSPPGDIAPPEVPVIAPDAETDEAEEAKRRDEELAASQSGGVAASSYVAPSVRAFAYLIEVTPEGLREVARITHRNLVPEQSDPGTYRMGEITRSIAIGERLYTLSDAGLVSTDLNELDTVDLLAW